MSDSVYILDLFMGGFQSLEFFIGLFFWELGLVLGLCFVASLWNRCWWQEFFLFTAKWAFLPAVLCSNALVCYKQLDMEGLPPDQVSIQVGCTHSEIWSTQDMLISLGREHTGLRLYRELVGKLLQAPYYSGSLKALMPPHELISAQYAQEGVAEALRTLSNNGWRMEKLAEDTNPDTLEHVEEQYKLLMLPARDFLLSYHRERYGRHQEPARQFCLFLMSVVPLGMACYMMRRARREIADVPSYVLLRRK